MEKKDEVQKIVEKSAYDTLRVRQHRLLGFVEDLLKQGQTPKQIEEHCRRRGATTIADLVYHAACYIRDKGNG